MNLGIGGRELLLATSEESSITGSDRIQISTILGVELDLEIFVFDDLIFGCNLSVLRLQLRILEAILFLGYS